MVESWPQRFGYGGARGLNEDDSRSTVAAPIEGDTFGPQPLLPDGAPGVLLVLTIWAVLSAALVAALLAVRPASPAWLYSAAPFVVFLVCLRGVRLIQRREQLRRAAARAQSRDLARARRSAFCTDNNYYVLDLLGTKRGPYSLEKIVRWHDEGKLGDEQVIFVGEATAPVAFDDVAALWRSQWGESPFDPTPLRAVWPRRVQ